MEDGPAGAFIVVSRRESARCEYVRGLFSGAVDVIVDRRLGQRRQLSHERAATDGRSAERRRSDIASDLHVLGWALIRR